MNFKTTITLLVLLLAVGVYFAATKLWHHVAPAQTATDTSKLVGFDQNDVTKVAVTQPDGKRVVLDKSGAQWRLVEPMNAEADSFNVDDLVRQLTTLQSRGELPADKKASVGLDHPAYVVELTGKEGKTAKLSFAPKSQIGEDQFVLVGDKDAPRIVASSGIYEQLDKPAASYRSKKLVNFPNDLITDVSITRDGKTLRLQKTGADWEIVEPKAMPADSSAVSTLLFALTDLSASDFVTDPSPPAAYGLTKPSMTVSFGPAGPPETSPAATTSPATAPTTRRSAMTIAFGRFQSVEQKDVYASVNGGPVVTVSATAVDSFRKTALDLRDKKVVDVDPATVSSFTLSVDRPAATQPTTRPADQHEYTIVRRQETFGPLPLPTPATAPAATQSAGATQPAAWPATSQPAVASSQPTTGPATAASQPASQPAVAASQPAAPPSKWVFQSGGTGDADDAQVESLLTALHPLRAEKFLEAAPTTQPAGTYTLTIHTGPAAGKGPQELVLRLTSLGPTGNVTASFNDAVFETDRSILDKLEGTFRKK